MAMDGVIVARPFGGEADYARLRQLVIETIAVGDERHYATIGDLDWWRYTDNDPRGIYSTQLWCAPGGAVIGCAWPVKNEIILLSDPRGRAIEAAMLDWAEERHRASGADEPLSAYSFDGDAARVALLRARGYVRQEHGYRYRRMALDGMLPELPPPAGYAVRNLGGDDEVEARVAVHCAAFAPSRMTVEKHRAVMAAPTYRQDLDLVVVAPDGQLAAYALGWFDATNRIGVFEPVGTDPAHQRRGLARAVLAEGLRRFRALEARVVYIVAETDNEASNRAYEAVGFREVDVDRQWVQGG
jgi:ribosomal protein S18 acetylase RimI-like enzyme